MKEIQKYFDILIDKSTMLVSSAVFSGQLYLYILLFNVLLRSLSPSKYKKAILDRCLSILNVKSPLKK